MTNSKKYAFKISQEEAVWTAQITRQVTSQKVVVSKEQSGFASEAEAISWAEEQLKEFTTTLEKSNKRHGAQRKNLEEQRRQRSNRRAEKTLMAKADKDKSEEESD
jgi:hypothetical protein